MPVTDRPFGEPSPEFRQRVLTFINNAPKPVPMASMTALESQVASQLAQAGQVMRIMKRGRTFYGPKRYVTTIPLQYSVGVKPGDCSDEFEKCYVWELTSDGAVWGVQSVNEPGRRIRHAEVHALEQAGYRVRC